MKSVSCLLICSVPLGNCIPVTLNFHESRVFSRFYGSWQFASTYFLQIFIDLNSTVALAFHQWLRIENAENLRALNFCGFAKKQSNRKDFVLYSMATIYLPNHVIDCAREHAKCQNLHNITTNIPILPEASLTFASKSCGPSHAAN